MIWFYLSRSDISIYDTNDVPNSSTNEVLVVGNTSLSVYLEYLFPQIKWLLFLLEFFFYGSSWYAGSNWHARIRSEQNHFIYNDLPRFIMDSYEECHAPPRLHLLDKYVNSPL